MKNSLSSTHRNLAFLPPPRERFRSFFLSGGDAYGGKLRLLIEYNFKGL